MRLFGGNSFSKVLFCKVKFNCSPLSFALLVFSPIYMQIMSQLCIALRIFLFKVSKKNSCPFKFKLAAIFITFYSNGSTENRSGLSTQYRMSKKN